MALPLLELSDVQTLSIMGSYCLPFVSVDITREALKELIAGLSSLPGSYEAFFGADLSIEN